MMADPAGLPEGIVASLAPAEAGASFAWAIATESDRACHVRWLAEPMASPDELARGSVQLWMAAVRKGATGGGGAGRSFDLTRAAALLDAEESARMRTLRQAEDRRLHAAAHAGKRLVLASPLGRAPEALRFRVSSDGKPGLAAESGAAEFSLSHAQGVVAVAVARTPVGVDVEPLQAGDRAGAMIDLVLAEDERALWRAAPGSLQGHLFLRYWTLKEALLKAAGLGFLVPPTAIRIDPGAPAALAVPEALGEASRWRLVAPAPDPGLEAWLRENSPRQAARRDTP